MDDEYHGLIMLANYHLQNDYGHAVKPSLRMRDLPFRDYLRPRPYFRDYVEACRIPNPARPGEEIIVHEETPLTLIDPYLAQDFSKVLRDNALLNDGLKNFGNNGFTYPKRALLLIPVLYDLASKRTYPSWVMAGFAGMQLEGRIEANTKNICGQVVMSYVTGTNLDSISSRMDSFHAMETNNLDEKTLDLAHEMIDFITQFFGHWDRDMPQWSFVLTEEKLKKASLRSTWDHIKKVVPNHGIVSTEWIKQEQLAGRNVPKKVIKGMPFHHFLCYDSLCSKTNDLCPERLLHITEGQKEMLKQNPKLYKMDVAGGVAAVAPNPRRRNRAEQNVPSPLMAPALRGMLWTQDRDEHRAAVLQAAALLVQQNAAAANAAAAAAANNAAAAGAANNPALVAAANNVAAAAANNAAAAAANNAAFAAALNNAAAAAAKAASIVQRALQANVRNNRAAAAANNANAAGAANNPIIVGAANNANAAGATNNAAAATKKTSAAATTKKKSAAATTKKKSTAATTKKKSAAATKRTTRSGTA